MCRTSSSIDRPCCAARTRSRLLSASSRLRIVMLAMAHARAIAIDAITVIIDCVAGKLAVEVVE